MSDAGIWFWLWVVAAVFLFIGEIFTAGFFLLPFGIGATVAAVLAFFQVGVGWQWATFIIVSMAAFFSMRRLSDKLTHEPPVKTGSDRLIGQAGIVLERLVPDSPEGEVRISREVWRADAPGYGIVPAGTRVTVQSIEGTHLIVHPEVERTEVDASGSDT